MQSWKFLLVAGLASGLTSASAADLHYAAIPPRAQQRLFALSHQVGPRQRAFVVREAKREIATNSISPENARSAIDSAGFGGLAQGDIDTLVEAVLAECAQEADQELQDEMNQMQANLAQKNAQRDRMSGMKREQLQTNDQLRRQYAAGQRNGTINPNVSFGEYLHFRPVTPGPSKSDLDGFAASKNQNLDSMGDMGEMQQMRLQMAMDQRQKAIEMLSNMMKREGDTANTISGNLK